MSVGAWVIAVIVLAGWVVVGAVWEHIGRRTRPRQLSQLDRRRLDQMCERDEVT
jgi:hypothetical protein